jgi:hypothetical protein
VRVPAGTFNTARHDLRGLDAIVRRDTGTLTGKGTGSVFVVVPEQETRPASWFDWSILPPLGFASVFPARLDCAQIELAGCNLGDPDQARLASSMMVAAAALSRSSTRIGKPGWFSRQPIGEASNCGGAIQAAFTGMARAFDSTASKFTSSERPAFVQTAARVVAAWASTAESGLGAEQRERLVAAACEGMENEAQQVLRLGAVQIATGQAEAGIRSLLWARRRLAANAVDCAVDPLPFVQSEIAMACNNDLSLGRVAAGLTLLFATSPVANHPYLREDLADDLNHAGWLSGRSSDRELLMRVMRELETAEQRDEASSLRRAA